MYLMHVGKDTIYDKINDLPPFAFPPGEPIEIKDDFIAGKILEHRRLDGLVEVPLVKTGKGLTFDIEGTKRKADEALRTARSEMVKRYIKTQLDDRISIGKPPLPPSPVVQRIIEEDKIDLQAEGINLSGAGWKVTYQEQDEDPRLKTLEEGFKLLLEQNQLLKAELKKLSERPTKETKQ